LSLPDFLERAHFDHISERETDGSWEDCTWCSGLEWFRLCFNRWVPSTHAEAEALRADSGEPPTGGSNMTNLRDGIRARYGIEIPAAISGFAALKSALKPGFAAGVQGSMKAFPYNHRLSVWQRNFDGSHAVLVVNIDGTLYWCDPEAPETADVPVVISWSELQQFVNAFAGQHVVAPVKEDILDTLATYYPDTDLIIKAESNIRADARIASPLLRTVPVGKTEVRRALGTVVGDVDPKNNSRTWFVWYNPMAKRFEFTALDNVQMKVRTGTAPDDGFTALTQEKAVLNQKAADQAAIDAANAAAAKATAALATAAADERERIALALAAEEAKRVRDTAV
jgi:hypothetical protein